MTDHRGPANWIGPAYRDMVTTQSYEESHIDGVRLLDLVLFSDEGGDFCEITRFTENGKISDFPDFSPAQVNYSLMEPGAIKAWHVHRKQDDLWFVPPSGRLLVGLLDIRETSKTYKGTVRIATGAGKPQCLFIPRGIAHGVANLGPGPATILYFVNETFNPVEPDEHRLPYDLLGADFWQIQPG